MTPNQRWLLAAANDARELVERIVAGKPLRGMHEDLDVGRNLAAAIAAVEGEGKEKDETAA